jgi:hypothetical protein
LIKETDELKILKEKYKEIEKEKEDSVILQNVAKKLKSIYYNNQRK